VAETTLGFLDGSFAPQSRPSIYAGGGGAVGQVTDITDAFTIMTGVMNGGSSSVDFDGTATNGALSAGTAMTFLALGATAIGAATFYGHIREFIWYNAALSDGVLGDIAKIKNYLSHKYQIGIPTIGTPTPRSTASARTTVS
jgi:hypothetical protein